MDDRDRAQQLTERTVKAIVEGDWADTRHADAKADRTAFQIGSLSDYGLERVEAWLDGMTRRAPINGQLFQAHKAILEAALDDIRDEINRRSRNGTS